jgi:hypothetical protein
MDEVIVGLQYIPAYGGVAVYEHEQSEFEPRANLDA